MLEDEPASRLLWLCGHHGHHSGQTVHETETDTVHHQRIRTPVR